MEKLKNKFQEDQRLSMSENIAEWEENREFGLKSTSAANRDVMIFENRSESLYFIL